MKNKKSNSEIALDELKREIFEKINQLTERVESSSKVDSKKNLSILIIVNDELEDVLLNWSDEALPRASWLDIDDLEDDNDDF